MILFSKTYEKYSKKLILKTETKLGMFMVRNDVILEKITSQTTPISAIPNRMHHDLI